MGRDGLACTDHRIGRAGPDPGAGHRTGRHRDAIRCYRRALTLFRRCGNTYETANTLDNLGQTCAAIGEHEQARAAWQEAVQLYHERGRDDDAKRVQLQI